MEKNKLYRALQGVRGQKPVDIDALAQVLVRFSQLAIDFHQSLSEESVYLRYAHSLKLSRRVAHDRLARLCFIDYDREIALIAVYDTDK